MRRMRARGIFVAVTVALAAALGAAAPAAAADFNVSSETIYQSYAVRTLYGTSPIEYKTRVTESLGLTATKLGGEKGLTLVARLRYDVDFGLADECEVGGIIAPLPYSTGTGPPYEPSRRLLCGNALEIQLLYVEGARLLGGTLDFRAGRQWKTDPLGWFAFDGALVTVRLPFFFSASLAAGFDAVNGLLFARNPWQPDGTAARVDGAPEAVGAANELSHDFSLHPSPFISVGLAARGFGRAHAEVVYRHVFGASLRTLTPLDEAHAVNFGWGDEEERIGWAVSYGFSDSFRVRAQVVADLLWPRFDEVTVEGSARLLDARLGVRGGVSFLRPRFSASSIFYYYDFRPTADAYVRADLHAGEWAWLYLRAAVRQFGNSWRFGADRDTGDQYVASGSTIDYGPAIDAGVRLELGAVTLDVNEFSAFGFAGKDVGAMASASWNVLPNRVSVLASGYVSYYDNVLQRDPSGVPLQAGVFGGASLGLDYRFGTGARIRLTAEDHLSPFWSSNVRVYGVLDLSFWL
jgi:hypothetical protein